MLSALKLGWDLIPGPIQGFWLDVLFGKEEPFYYTSVTCPHPDSSSS